MKKAIIIFTRVPVPGHTKTRMMKVYSPKQCAGLHASFLKDIKGACMECGADIYISYTPDGYEYQSLLERILNLRVEYIPQQGDTLGERMYHAIAKVLGQGYDSCILLGADVPEVKSSHLKRAFHILQSKDVVFGETVDGGYYLVGMSQIHPEVFELREYGHSAVLKDTLEHLKRMSVSVGYAEKLNDMDTPEDIKGYWGRMIHDRKLQRSATGKYVARLRKISIIIPVYNEEKKICLMKEQLKPLKAKCEIIFVDGGSTDSTLQLLGGEYPVLHTQKGRAHQMNEGAKASCGDVLFFLHCDSELPEEPLAEIRRVMKEYCAGCFGIAFHSNNFFMLICRIISNHRIKDRKVMFGDQGIFLDRDLFFLMGMFPEIQIMEDYQFSLTLKEHHIPLGLTKRRIYTSVRRFPTGTIPKLRMMWRMNRLRKMYRDGVPIETISKMYRDIR